MMLYFSSAMRPTMQRDAFEPVVVGLPDTICFPADALRTLPADERGRVLRIEVKSRNVDTRWVLGRLSNAGAHLP